MLDLNDPRVEWASFGRMVEDFLQGPIGDYLVKKAEEQSAEAMEKLKVTPPEDANAIRTHQNQIQVAESIIRWLGEAVHEGQMALEHLKEESDG